MSYQQKQVADRENEQPDFGHTLTEHLSHIKASWPGLYECVDPVRASADNYSFMTDLNLASVDFDSASQGGRGESYRRAQQNPLTRAVGIRQLFELVSKDQDLQNMTPNHKVLDVLGGDGLLARAMALLVPPHSLPSILTSDLSEDMVSAARAYGLFALRQPAQNLLLKDNSVDGVIVAYGTHHIPEDQRLQACQEAYRVLKPGGRIVLHDFEVDSPMSRWFGEVVDRYSRTGHSFPHFTAEEITGYLVGAGFEEVDLKHMYDPFILTGHSQEMVKHQLADCLLNMYGLVKLVDLCGYEDALEVVYALSAKYFRYEYGQNGLSDSFMASQVTVVENNTGWQIEAPRVALVGCGVKRG